MPGEQSRRWSATLNNYTEEHIEKIQELFNEQQLSYVCYGKEVGESGTPHLQIYLEIPKKKTLMGIKSIIGIHTIHLEKSVGTMDQNKEYCSKEGDFYQFGTPMSSGTKRTLFEVSEYIKDGKSLKEIVELDTVTYIRYHRGIERAMLLLNPSLPRNFKSFCKVFIGPTGTGKSREAHENYDIGYTHGGDRWFDNYHDHQVVLFDDFDGIKSGITFRKLLQITDRYPLTVPIKGGFVNWRPVTIIFTTNVEIKDWYPEEDSAPLLRRIDEVKRFANLMPPANLLP